MVNIHFIVSASFWFQLNQDLILILNIPSGAQMLTPLSLTKTTYYVLESMLGGGIKDKNLFWAVKIDNWIIFQLFLYDAAPLPQPEGQGNYSSSPHTLA